MTKASFLSRLIVDKFKYTKIENEYKMLIMLRHLKP